MNMDKKRSRSVNWDEEEKQLLRFALRDHANIIENKAIDTKTIKLKNKAWEEVYKKFNELNVRHRNIIQLKIQWKTMKLKARKRRKIKRELGEVTAASLNDGTIEIKELYNTEETLKHNNLKPMAFVDTCINDITQQSQHITDCIETIDNIGAELDNQKIYTPKLRIAKGILEVPLREKNMGTIPVKIMPKPMPKPNVMPNILENGTHKKDYEDHISSIINHIKNLKDEEHRRRLEMAEEEHSLKIAIQMEKLKSATIEREILELKQAREVKLDSINKV